MSSLEFDVDEQSIRRFVEIYIDEALELAQEGYSLNEFYDTLHRNISKKISLSLDAVKYIGQVLANFEYLKPTPFGRNGSSPWLKDGISDKPYSPWTIELGRFPSREEKTSRMEEFVKFYGLEMMNRAGRVYRYEKPSRDFFSNVSHQES